MKKRVEIYLREIMWTQWIGFEYIGQKLPSFNSSEIQRKAKQKFYESDFRRTTFKSAITYETYRLN